MTIAHSIQSIFLSISSRSLLKRKTMLLLIPAVIVSLIAAEPVFANPPKLETIYEWKYIDYQWLSSQHKETFKQFGLYKPENIIPSDVYRAPDGRAFVTLLGDQGVPARLATISDEVNQAGPLLKPYPNWDWHDPQNCDNIRNVYRVAVDKCNRLWVPDTGYQHQESPFHCSAQVLVFDLNTDRLIKRIKVPNHIAGNATGTTLLANVEIYTEGKTCENTKAIISDTMGGGLIIVDYDTEKLTRIENPTFKYDSEAAEIISGELKIFFPAGILGMTLTDDSDLFYRPLASYDMYKFNFKDWQKDSSALNVKAWKNLFTEHETVHDMSKTGIMFMGLAANRSVACWNPENSRFIEILEQDKNRFDYINGVHVFGYNKPSTGWIEELWVFSNRLVRARLNGLNIGEVNFRVLAAPVQQLVEGTKCLKTYEMLSFSTRSDILHYSF